jgi:malate dehydrogenase (oxaloacetate-decarboxylating)(NADP+)
VNISKPDKRPNAVHPDKANYSSDTMNGELGKSSFPTGLDLLHNPRLNKGTGFPEAEREMFHLRGLLPPRVFTQEAQESRILAGIRKLGDPLQQYQYLIDLQDRNEALFYRVVMDHLTELMPLIYTPTIGRACQEYGNIFRRTRGMYFSTDDRGNFRRLFDNWPDDDVRVIVVTDGERILGLGDLGAHGMGIPVGKLSLYTACAGVDPGQCLPVMLDVGTNNTQLLEDPFYLGMPHARLRGEEYDSLVEEFIQAANDRFPGVLIQLEDFGNTNAFRLLRKYRDNFCLFNDDIQGTAAVSLAGLYSALRLTKGRLIDQTILMLGAGEAATGISDLIVHAMVAEGLPVEEARRRCWLFDSKGLVVQSRGSSAAGLASHKMLYAHDHEEIDDLLTAVRTLRPTALIGASGVASTFTKEVLEAVASYQEQPIVFALSNPTSQSECTAEEAYTCTNGRAIFASGSPFPTVTIGDRTIVPGQANNAYIFPGVGLGVIASGARHITNEMFFEAARALANAVSEDDLRMGRVYPSLEEVRSVSVKIAMAVARVAFRSGLNALPQPEDLRQHVTDIMYDPQYKSYL